MSRESKFVLHGGFGISYERVEGNYYTGRLATSLYYSCYVSSGNIDTLTSANPVTGNPSTISNSPDLNLQHHRVKTGALVYSKTFFRCYCRVELRWLKLANLSYYKTSSTSSRHPAEKSWNRSECAGPTRLSGHLPEYEWAISNYHSLQARILKRCAQAER